MLGYQDLSRFFLVSCKIVYRCVTINYLFISDVNKWTKVHPCIRTKAHTGSIGIALPVHDHGTRRG